MRLSIFDTIQQKGNLSDEEMYRTFNCGVGMLIVADQNTAFEIVDRLDFPPCIGRIAEKGKHDQQVLFQ